MQFHIRASIRILLAKLKVGVCIIGVVITGRK